MKIIEALKQIKHLDRKTEKAEDRVAEWCSYISDDANPEKPLYDAEEVRKMIQQITDWQKEKAKIRHLLHKTNLSVSAKFDGKERNIDELLLLQAIVIPKQIEVLKSMNRKNISNYDKREKAKVVLHYDPKAKEKEIDNLENMAIDLNNLLDNLSLSIEVVE